MSIRNVLVCILILVTVSVQSLPDPKQIRIRKVARAINSFGISLFIDLTIYEGQRSVLICPYSLSSSLGILQFVSAGKTKTELADVLGHKAANLTKEQVAHTFYMFSTQLLRSSKPKFYIFHLASTILMNKGRIKGPSAQIRREAEVFFQIPITVANFREMGDELVGAVNDWTAAITEDTIRNILQFADPSSDIIVSDTAYFKGVWKHKFPPAESKLGVFYNYGLESTATEVHMMSMKKKLYFNQDEDFSIVELPFKGRNTVSMIILLPRKLDGIHELLGRFSPDFLKAKIEWMSQIKTHIVLP